MLQATLLRTNMAMIRKAAKGEEGWLFRDNPEMRTAREASDQPDKVLSDARLPLRRAASEGYKDPPGTSSQLPSNLIFESKSVLRCNCPYMSVVLPESSSCTAPGKENLGSSFAIHPAQASHVPLWVIMLHHLSFKVDKADPSTKQNALCNNGWEPYSSMHDMPESLLLFQ